MIQQYRGLPREIYNILINKVISAVGMFVYPFLTLFLSNRLNFTEQMIGFYLLLLSLSYVPAAMIGGKIADHLNRKYTLVIATLLAELSLIASGFLCDSFAVVYFLFLATFFLNMSQPVSTAMLMDLTTPANRQESFSLIYLGNNVGGAIGPLLAGFLFVSHTEWIFFGEAILNLLGLAFIVFGVKDTKPDQAAIERIAAEEDRNLEQAREGSIFRVLRESPLLLWFGITASFLTFAYAQISFLVPLQLDDLFGTDLSAKYFGLLFSVNCLAVVIGTPLLVLATKAVKPLTNMLIVGLLYMTGFGLYSISEQLSLFLIFTLIWTAGEILFVTNTGVFVANHSPITHRARFQSIFEIIQGSGRAIGPLITGYYLMSHSIPQTWVLVAILCGFATLLLFFLRRSEDRKH